ncbi:MAG TPA: hypothetical protein VKU80_13805 [Planctomycetota bacterium]|nr:hypothetical protein [Planctomycetota bacterium]
MSALLVLAITLLGPWAALQAPQEAPPPSPPRPSEWTAEEKADPVAAARHQIEQRETPGNLARAIALLQWRKERGPEAAEVEALLAEAHYRTLDGLNPTKKEDQIRRKLECETGLKEAREAVRLAPAQPEGHYWLGCLLLESADIEQSYSRLKQAIPELREGQRLGPKFDEGGPARMLGRVYQETPGWPFLGSRSEAIRWYAKSLEAAPEALRTHLWLGQTYAADHQTDRARQELEKVISAKARPGREVETREVREEAETLLKSLPPK